VPWFLAHFAVGDIISIAIIDADSRHNLGQNNNSLRSLFAQVTPTKSFT
jgi:hypothetical protein